MLVLLVDDDPLILMICRATLESAGHQVIENDDGLGTGAMVLQEHPDVVLIDLEMPGLPGAKLVKLLREQGEPGDAPLLLLHSGREESELAEAVSECQADGYLQKTAGAAGFLEAFDRATEKLTS